MLRWEEVAQPGIEFPTPHSATLALVVWLILTNRIWQEVMCASSAARLLGRLWACVSSLHLFLSASWIQMTSRPQGIGGRGNDIRWKDPGPWMTMWREATYRLKHLSRYVRNKLSSCQTITCLGLFVTAAWSTLNNTDGVLVWSGSCNKIS